MRRHYYMTLTCDDFGYDSVERLKGRWGYSTDRQMNTLGLAEMNTVNYV